MSTKKKPAKAKAPSVAGEIVPSGWKLGTDFETVQIVPATGYWATYADGGRFPVVAWAMQSRLLRVDERDDFDDEEVPPGFVSRVVGLVMCAKDAVLCEADSPLIVGNDDDFTGYEWDL
jgi:hypothetical protein